MANTEVEQVEKVEKEQERKAILNPYGLVLVLGVAAYSLLCIYVGNATLGGLNNLAVTRKILDNTTEVVRFYENRSNFVVNWSHILGIPKHVGNITLNFVQLNRARIFYGVALICFLWGSLLHLYVAFWTLFQPSYAAGRNGKKVQTSLFKEYRFTNSYISFYVSVGCFAL